MTRKLISIIAGSLFMAAAFAVQAQLSGSGFQYVINSEDTNTITLTNYIGSTSIVDIPSNIDGLIVTGIGNGSNTICTNGFLTNVTIPDTVVSVNDDAFETNKYLTNVTFGAGVTSIGEYSFYECYGLTNVTLPDSVVEVGYGAFYYCYYMTNCTLGQNVVDIDDYAFYYCEDLQKMVIPASVQEIGYYAFYYCYDMTNLSILGSPDIGYYAFYECEDMQNLSIAGGVIEDGAFYYCYDLTNLNLGKVSSIGEEAFYECEYLTNLTIPPSVQYIGYYAFYDCEYMTNLVIQGSPLIDEYAFYEDEGLQNAYIHGGSIGYGAFEYCYDLTNLVMGTNVTGIGEYAFYDCEYMKNATISGYIGYEAFYDCAEIANITLNNASVPYYTFEELYSLTNLAVTNSQIGEGAFYYDYNLTNLTIGPGCTLADYAFEYCYYMQNAYIGSGNPGYYCFYDCEDLTNLTIGPGVSSIGEYAFYYCGMSNLVVPATVTNLGDEAFYDCYGLTNVTIDSQHVGNYAFDDCTNLKTAIFGKDVKTLGEEVFYDDTNLTAIYFQGSAPSAAGSAFFGINNPNLKLYYYSDTAGWSSFYEGFPTSPLAPNALQVALSPTAARTNGAAWELDYNGSFQTNSVTTIMDISPGIHTVSFTTIPGWISPAIQTVVITNGGVAYVSGIYIQTNLVSSNGLVLQTNGYGVIHHGPWPKVLVDGRKYTVTAVPDKNNVFISWTGGQSNETPFVLSTSPTFAFTMAPGLILAANFETNEFHAASGTYNGLFYSTQSNVTVSTAGMLRNFSVRNNATYSGTVAYEGTNYSITGTFNGIGMASNHVARMTNQGGPLLVQISLDSADSPPEILGVISGTNGTGTNAYTWTANLTAYLATNDLGSGNYTTLADPDTDNAPPVSSPGGDSFATVSVHKDTATVVTMLADGTTVSESVPVSGGSYLPIYSSLYAGNGLLLGWIDLNTNNSDSTLTWIHPPTTSGRYKAGFTNTLGAGNIFVSTWPLYVNPNVFTNLALVDFIGDTNTLTNYVVTTTTAGKITGTGVKGSVDVKNGTFKVEIGSGADRITGSGAILIGAGDVPTFGGGFFLTSTNSQGIELLP